MRLRALRAVIALIQLALPSDLLVLADEHLDALRYETVQTELEAVGEVQVFVLSPYRSTRPVTPGTPGGDPGALEPADPQPTDPNIEIDGRPGVAVRCNAIAVNIIASEFDRRTEAVHETVPRLLTLACDAVNGVLQRLRVMARAAHLKPLQPDPGELTFRLVFLDEQTKELIPEEEGKFRQGHNSSFRIEHMGITSEAWKQAAGLGEYKVPPWDELLLDGMDLKAELGPSLVLAATAVETRIAHALDTLSEGKLPSGLWTWIGDRDGPHKQTPSVAEQLDVLLEELGGRSLKEDARLWQAGANLRSARNSFVHRGRATVGKDLVTRARAAELVQQAGEIIDFIEALLPEENRRPRLERETQVLTKITLFRKEADGDQPG
jgi:hypothetical protein